VGFVPNSKLHSKMFEYRLRYDKVSQKWDVSLLKVERFGPHRMHEKWTIATDVPEAWCLSDCLSRACALQKRLHESRSCLWWRLLRAQETLWQTAVPIFPKYSMRSLPNNFCQFTRRLAVESVDDVGVGTTRFHEFLVSSSLQNSTILHQVNDVTLTEILQQAHASSQSHS